MKTLIITPAYTHVCHQTIAAVQASGLPWAVEHGHSDLPRVRSYIIGKALETEAERVILLDADVVPTAAALSWLADTDEVTPDQAVWGLYELKDGRWSVQPRNAQEFSDTEDGALVPIVWGGLGICCIHRESLERVEAGLQADHMAPVREENGVEWAPYCLPFVARGVYYPDDKSLCHRLTQAGVDLVCRRDLIAGHMAARMLTGPGRPAAPGT
jgi:hypothetical protein